MMDMDDEASRVREVLRRRASIEARTGLKWNASDTVALLLLDASLTALNEQDRGKPKPFSW